MASIDAASLSLYAADLKAFRTGSQGEVRERPLPVEPTRP
jgi:hypothetical protein